jgi:uncharacterized NAD(P)/FAD-binding protein YdhS
MMAVRLLNADADGAFDVVLINRPQLPNPGTGLTQETGALPEHAKSLARGLAYGTNSADHLLNVPAGRMSAFDELPHDFEAYLRRRNVAADGGSFVARKWYGDYLRSTLDTAAAKHSPRPNASRFLAKHATVTTVDRCADGRLQLALVEAGMESRLLADRVVLALGNFSPADVGLLEPRFYESVRYLRDPWQTGGLSRLDLSRPVVLIGTGLTMLDVAATLKRRAVAAGMPMSLIAISRRGLLAQAHRLRFFRRQPTSPMFAQRATTCEVCAAAFVCMRRTAVTGAMLSPVCGQSPRRCGQNCQTLSAAGFCGTLDRIGRATDTARHRKPRP